VTADETAAQGDEATTATGDAGEAGQPGVEADGWRDRSEPVDQRRGDDAGALVTAAPVTAIGPAIRDVATRLERIEVALAAWLAPLEGTDEEGRPPAPAPGVQTVLARLDEQAVTAERNDEAFAEALRDLVDQLNEFAGTIGAAGAGRPANIETLTDTVTERLLDGVLPPIQALEATVARRLAEVESQLTSAVAALVARPAAAPPSEPGDAARPVGLDVVSVAAAVEAATTRAIGALRHQLDQVSAEVAAARTAAPHVELLERLDRLGVALQEARTAPPPTVLERLERLAAAVDDTRATRTTATDSLGRVAEDVAALRAAVPASDPNPRLDEIAGALGALSARVVPLADLPASVDRARGEVMAAVTDLVSRLRILDDLPATVARTEVELAHRFEALGGLPDAVAAVEAAAVRSGAAAGSLDALAELLDAVRDDVVPLGTTLPAALARLEVELTVVGERTAEATAVARDAGTATERLRTDVESTLAEVQRLAPPGDDGGIGAAVGRLEARAAEQARLLATVQETVADLARTAPTEVDALERTVVADLDAVGDQLDAVGRVLQQLVGTLAVVEAGTIGVSPRAERSHTAAQSALADLRAARRR
jgi:hypothetical protein